MNEFGIFSSEGLLEGEFYSLEEAITAHRERYADDDAHAAEICQDHPGQAREGCEECNSDETSEATAPRPMTRAEFIEAIEKLGGDLVSYRASHRWAHDVADLLEKQGSPRGAPTLEEVSDALEELKIPLAEDESDDSDDETD